MTQAEQQPTDSSLSASRLEEIAPPGPRTYRSAWIHDRLLTAEEWLAEEAHGYEQMEDDDDEPSDGPSDAGTMRAIAAEIARLRQAVTLHEADATRNADEVRRLQRERDEAVKDSKRLDWMEASAAHDPFITPTARKVVRSFDVRRGFRDAIDEEMEHASRTTLEGA